VEKVKLRGGAGRERAVTHAEGVWGIRLSTEDKKFRSKLIEKYCIVLHYDM